jgi:DNA repair protein RadA/Sms
MKDKTVYVCNSCGFETQKWLGKCFQCGAYNSFVEQKNTISLKGFVRTSHPPVKISEINPETYKRIPTNIKDFDSSISGGIATGQVILIGGEPGVGKSTLVLQIAAAKQLSSIYVCGEESEIQVKNRAQRLGLDNADILMTRELEIESLMDLINQTIAGQGNQDRANLVVIDSIQSVYSSMVASAPGSISQVQFCTNKLVQFSKENNIRMILIGQITKVGLLAGPKALEHLVDTVLYLEGDKKSDMRILKVVKNRFGSTEQTGLFTIGQEGFVSVNNFKFDHQDWDKPGALYSLAIEGIRPILVEVQALNTLKSMPIPRRIANGFPINRMNMILAVLERRVGIKTDKYDLYVNVSGGIKINDSALDLPVALSVASVIKNKILPRRVVAFGELGLLGEVKRVAFEERRLAEAKKLGFDLLITPRKNQDLKKIIIDSLS